jgi:hypothetical protein
MTILLRHHALAMVRLHLEADMAMGLQVPTAVIQAFRTVLWDIHVLVWEDHMTTEA